MYLFKSAIISQGREHHQKETAWEVLLIFTTLLYLCGILHIANAEPSRHLIDFILNTKENEKDINGNTPDDIVGEREIDIVRPYLNNEVESSTDSSYDFDKIVDDNFLSTEEKYNMNDRHLDTIESKSKNVEKQTDKGIESYKTYDSTEELIDSEPFDSNAHINIDRRKRNSVISEMSSTQSSNYLNNDQEVDVSMSKYRTFDVSKDISVIQKPITKPLIVVTTAPTKLKKNVKKEESKINLKKDLDMNYQGDMPFERLPRIELLANEVLSELNVKQILECKVPSNATMTAWYKNGKIMDMAAESSGNRLSVSKSGDAIIARVRKEDDGSWICKGVDWLGNRISAEPVSLIVLETPSIPTFEVAGNSVNTSLPNRVISAREGGELNATCSVLGGRPKPKITWMFRKLNNLPIPDPTGNENDEELLIEEKNTDSGRLISTARVTIQRIHHNATLTCTMTHPTLATSLHSTVKIDVQYPPRFAISRVPGFGFPLAEGTPVSLRCEVESNPPSLPKWFKDDGEPPVPQTEDGFLNFTVLKKEHSGWYKCTANHSFGVFSSIGYFLNVRYDVIDGTDEPNEKEKPTPAKVEVALGGAVQLQCPTGSIGCWGRWSGTRWAGAGSEAPHGALSLRGLLYQQAGQYRCEGLSRGTQGRLQVLREHTILVTGGPTVFPSNRTILANEGSSAHLSAEFCANPAPIRVMWIAGNRIYRLGDMHGSIVVHNATNSSSPDCWMAELTVVPVGLQHSGEYSLLIRNVKGSTEAIFMLAVTASRSVTKSENILNEWLRRNSSSPSIYCFQISSFYYIAVLYFIKILFKIS